MLQTQVLQAPLLPVELLLVGPLVLRAGRSDVLRSGRPDVRRAGRPDLRRSGRELLQLMT